MNSKLQQVNPFASEKEGDFLAFLEMPRRIAVVTAQFNAHITHALEKGVIETLSPYATLHCIKAPGAVELPLLAQKAFDAGVDAVICLGCVIRGDTTHYEYVCHMASQGILDVSLKYGKPVIFGVLTCENEAQAIARTLDDLNGVEDAVRAKLKGLAPVGHKGREAGEAVLETLYGLYQLSLLSHE
jgi:6,7-dimethyl-8-ribityllumazine synthase